MKTRFKRRDSGEAGRGNQLAKSSECPTEIVAARCTPTEFHVCHSGGNGESFGEERSLREVSGGRRCNETASRLRGIEKLVTEYFELGRGRIIGIAAFAGAL